METVTDFILGGLKITADGNCTHEIKRHLLLGRKAMTNLVSILQSRDITLPTVVRLVKAMVFPVVMYRCESWTIKKAEHRRIDAFELWCWRRLLRVPWTARRSNQSILKEISPEYSLEELMLKLKLQYFGHLMRRTDSLERPWCWERLKAGGEGDDRAWDGWMASPTQWTWVWVNSRSWRWTGRPGVLQSMGSQRVRHDWATELNCKIVTAWVRVNHSQASGDGIRTTVGWQSWWTGEVLGGNRGIQAGIHWFLCAPVLHGIITTLESLWEFLSWPLLTQNYFKKGIYRNIAPAWPGWHSTNCCNHLIPNWVQISPRASIMGFYSWFVQNWIQTISTYCIWLLDLLCFFQAEITPSSFFSRMFVCWRTWVVCPVESPHILWRFL